MWTLKATKNNVTKVHRFEAGSIPLIDASCIVMDLASDDPVWAKGFIQLVNPSGVVVETIAEKD